MGLRREVDTVLYDNSRFKPQRKGPIMYFKTQILSLHNSNVLEKLTACTTLPKAKRKIDEKQSHI